MHIWIHDDMDKGAAAAAAILDTCVIMTLYMAPMDPLSFRFYNSLCHHPFITNIMSRPYTLYSTTVKQQVKEIRKHTKLRLKATLLFAYLFPQTDSHVNR